MRVKTCSSHSPKSVYFEVVFLDVKMTPTVLKTGPKLSSKIIQKSIWCRKIINCLSCSNLHRILITFERSKSFQSVVNSSKSEDLTMSVFASIVDLILETCWHPKSSLCSFKAVPESIENLNLEMVTNSYPKVSFSTRDSRHKWTLI